MAYQSPSPSGKQNKHLIDNSMRRIVLLLSFMLLCFNAMSQGIEHIVTPGETVKSIAEKYGVSEAALVEANPNLANFVYVGMKLSIPIIASNEKGQEEDVKDAPLLAPVAEAPVANAPSQVLEGEESGAGFQFGMSFMWMFPIFEKQEGFSYTNFGMSVCFNGGYFLAKHFFASAGVGYSYSISSTSAERGSDVYDILGNFSTEIKSHSITVPVRFGVKYSSFLAYTGPQFYFPLVIKQTEESGKEKSTTNISKKEVSVGLPIGIGIGFNDFYLCFEYIVGLKKDSNNAWSIGIRGNF